MPITNLEKQLHSALVTARVSLARDHTFADEEPTKGMFRRKLTKVDKALAAFKTKQKK